MCRALARVLAPPPSILGLLPPPSLLRMLVSLALGSVIPGLLLDWLLLRYWWFGGFVFVGVIESLMFLYLFCVFAILSLIISASGDVSVFMEAAATWAFTVAFVWTHFYEFHYLVIGIAFLSMKLDSNHKK
ncbi:unnamed protein product [Prunus armeniaca]